MRTRRAGSDSFAAVQRLVVWPEWFCGPGPSRRDVPKMRIELAREYADHPLLRRVSVCSFRCSTSDDDEILVNISTHLMANMQLVMQHVLAFRQLVLITFVKLRVRAQCGRGPRVRAHRWRRTRGRGPGGSPCRTSSRGGSRARACASVTPVQMRSGNAGDQARSVGWARLGNRTGQDPATER